MNFLLHLHLAARDTASPAAAHGAMLPDLWRMADRRVRARAAFLPLPTGEAGAGLVDEEIERGIAHHHRADAWFHASPHLEAGERAAIALFRSAELAAPRMGLLAHVLWEVCLDGALVRTRGEAVIAGELAEGFRAADAQAQRRAVARHHFAAAGRTDGERAAFEANMGEIGERILGGGWVRAYAQPAGLVRVTDGIRRRLGLPVLGERDRAPLEAVFAALLDEAQAVLPALLDSPL